jgi:hypothetical protein
MKKQFRNFFFIFLAAIFSVLSINAKNKIGLIDTTCCTPDSLTVVSLNYPVFCVSWHVRTDSGCTTPYGFIVQWKKFIGTDLWKEKIVLYTSGTTVNFCDSIDSCGRWLWRVRTICKIDSNNTTYSDWVYGPRFAPQPIDCNHDFSRQGTSEKSSTSRFEIVPNPASNRITILTNETMDKKSVISITDAAGMSYYRKQGIAQGGGKNIPIDISALKPGLYFIRMETAKGVFIKSFVKQ